MTPSVGKGCSATLQSSCSQMPLGGSPPPLLTIGFTNPHVPKCKMIFFLGGVTKPMPVPSICGIFPYIWMGGAPPSKTLVLRVEFHTCCEFGDSRNLLNSLCAWLAVPRHGLRICFPWKCHFGRRDGDCTVLSCIGKPCPLEGMISRFLQFYESTILGSLDFSFWGELSNANVWQLSGISP